MIPWHCKHYKHFKLQWREGLSFPTLILVVWHGGLTHVSAYIFLRRFSHHQALEDLELPGFLGLIKVSRTSYTVARQKSVQRLVGNQKQLHGKTICYTTHSFHNRIEILIPCSCPSLHTLCQANWQPSFQYLKWCLTWHLSYSSKWVSMIVICLLFVCLEVFFCFYGYNSGSSMMLSLTESHSRLGLD